VITLYNKGIIGATKLGEKIIQLREVIDVQFAKTDMVIHKSDDTGPILNDDDLDKPAQTCVI